MIKFGILTPRQYEALKDRRRYRAYGVAYSLLYIGDEPSPEQVAIFEDVSFTLRTSNGTYRTTFHHRFKDIDQASMDWLGRLFPGTALRIQDRAVSHGLTSAEWAVRIFERYPDADFEASDLLAELLEVTLDSGEKFVTEPSGIPLQYIRPPFVVALSNTEPKIYPLNHCIAAYGKYRWRHLALPENWTRTSGGQGYRVRTIPFLHPETRRLLRQDARFRFCLRSVFEPTPGQCDVLRTMNILNRKYFSQERLEEGVRAAFGSLRQGGLWILGRTSEDDFSNHATFLCRRRNGWEVLGRIGEGSEIEELATGLTVAA